MSEMSGQQQLLNICFTCLRYSRVAQSGVPLVRAPNVGSLFLRGQTRCGHCRYFSFTQGPDSSTKDTKKDEDSITNNPFYEKYKQKLQNLAASEPEEYKARLQHLVEEKNPSKGMRSPPADGKASSPAPEPIPRHASYTTTKGLDSVMKLELMQDKSAAEVEEIWKEYHKNKDCVFAVLQKDAFEDFMTKGQSCPTFVYPLPRDDGHEFILMQFDGKDVQFTPLAMYQMLKENAPACLTLVHYTDLMESKGIVLMSGQYDDKVLKREEAVVLVQMMSIYYGKNSSHFDRVKIFNNHPEQFDHNQLIQDYRGLYLDTKPMK